MTIRDRIITYLQRHPEGVDDDTLSEALDLKHRQQANQRCRQLEDEGLLVRREVRGKIHNFWQGGEDGESQSISTLASVSSVHPQSASQREWYWEGHVQAAIVSHLVQTGYIIHAVAHTATRRRGKDIIAEQDGQQLWISVKGYPRGTQRTPPSTQAGHWFKQAIFDVLVYRGESQAVQLSGFLAK